DLIFNKNVMPEKIALHIPDLETLKPYIKQELKNYCVPFTIRSGEPITVNSAARIFENINTCVQEDFSYDALRSLLLNAYLPWSEKNLNQNLVLEGKRLKCICNYNDDDIWVSSLKQTNTNEREINFYVKLKKSILQIYYATSFKNLLTAWSAFRNDFFSTDDFSSSANNILGRCVTLLDKLVSIEDEYILPKKLKVDSPFSFFLNELKNTTYREQEVINGISVFEYKVAPIAPFDYNIVLDASQDNLEVARQNLPFVSLQKRKQLGVTEKTDLSEEFIKLYSTSASSRQATIFSFSEETFSGFAISHSFFKKDILPTDFSYLKEIDFFHQEKNLFLGEKIILNKISANQAEQLDKWIFFNSMNETKEIENKNLKQKIEYILKEKRNCNKIIITQKDLKTFFPCKRKWIFQEALKISEDTFTVDLIDNFTSGNIHHKILELFFSDYVNAHLPIYDGSAFVPDNEKVLQSIFQKAEKAILSLDKIKNQKFVIEVLLNQKEKFAENIVELLKVFLSEQKYGSHIVKFTEKWHTKFSEECEYGYGGIIDLVLENNELYDTIIDFKNTGSSLPSSKDCKKTEDETLADFQCPMYITLLDDKKNNISAMIFHAIKFSKSSKKIKTPIVNNFKKDSKEKSQSSEEYKSTLKVFEEYCELFYKNISENDFTPVNFSLTCTDEEKKQNVKPYESCFSCQFKTICRTQYTISPRYLPGKKKI
ncbi:MAG: PD-(D/E)XK nuclease family protein, partial [Treponema sp.]|nr:PD-(D/E)XK nuclease family protein [Treponema sp.]